MRKKILAVVSALLGLLLINAGLNKFFFYMPVPEDLSEGLKQINQAVDQIGFLLPLIGAAELFGGFLLLFPKTRALGLLIVLPVMTGVLLTHLMYDPVGIPMVVVIWCIMLWIFVEDRHKFKPLLGK